MVNGNMVTRRNPLTAKGRTIMRAMKREYGPRGKSVFYASSRAGRITGVERNPMQHFLDRSGHELLWGSAALLAIAWLTRSGPGTGAFSNVGTGSSYWQRPAITPQGPSGVGNTPYGANPRYAQILPPAAINGLLPSTTVDAFAALPRSVALQGP